MSDKRSHDMRYYESEVIVSEELVTDSTVTEETDSVATINKTVTDATTVTQPITAKQTTKGFWNETLTPSGRILKEIGKGDAAASIGKADSDEKLQGFEAPKSSSEVSDNLRPPVSRSLNTNRYASEQTLDKLAHENQLEELIYNRPDEEVFEQLEEIFSRQPSRVEHMGTSIPEARKPDKVSKPQQEDELKNLRAGVTDPTEVKLVESKNTKKRRPGLTKESGNPSSKNVETATSAEGGDAIKLSTTSATKRTTVRSNDEIQEDNSEEASRETGLESQVEVESSTKHAEDTSTVQTDPAPYLPQPAPKNQPNKPRGGSKELDLSGGWLDVDIEPRVEVESKEYGPKKLETTNDVNRGSAGARSEVVIADQIQSSFVDGGADDVHPLPPYVLRPVERGKKGKVEKPEGRTLEHKNSGIDLSGGWLGTANHPKIEVEDEVAKPNFNSPNYLDSELDDKRSGDGLSLGGAVSETTNADNYVEVANEISADQQSIEIAKQFFLTTPPQSLSNGANALIQEKDLAINSLQNLQRNQAPDTAAVAQEEAGVASETATLILVMLVLFAFIQVLAVVFLLMRKNSNYRNALRSYSEEDTDCEEGDEEEGEGKMTKVKQFIREKRNKVGPLIAKSKNRKRRNSDSGIVDEEQSEKSAQDEQDAALRMESESGGKKKRVKQKAGSKKEKKAKQSDKLSKKEEKKNSKVIKQKGSSKKQEKTKQSEKCDEKEDQIDVENDEEISKKLEASTSMSYEGRQRMEQDAGRGQHSRGFPSQPNYNSDRHRSSQRDETDEVTNEVLNTYFRMVDMERQRRSSEDW